MPTLINGILEIMKDNVLSVRLLVKFFKIMPFETMQNLTPKQFLTNILNIQKQITSCL